MLPVTMQTSALNTAYRAQVMGQMQQPVAPGQLPAASVPAAPAASGDHVTLSNLGLWKASQAMSDHPVGVSMISDNEKVDAMAQTVYGSQTARQAIKTYTETYQMASEQWQPTEKASA